MNWARVVALVTLACAGVAVYEHARRHLRTPGAEWPVGRILAWNCGVLLAAAGFVAPVPDRFSGRVLEHALLGMAAPWLLVAGRPVTLALRSGDGVAHRWARALVRGPRLHLLSHPIVAAALFAIGPWLLWLTPLYELETGSALFHTAVHVHLLASGFLFGVAVLGLEPTAWRSRHGLRLLAAATLLPLHSLLAMVLLSARIPLLNPELPIAAGLADQRAGASLAWVVGDGLATVALLLIGAQWARTERHLRLAA